jgi:hypothetical protein
VALSRHTAGDQGAPVGGQRGAHAGAFLCIDHDAAPCAVDLAALNSGEPEGEFGTGVGDDELLGHGWVYGQSREGGSRENVDQMCQTTVNDCRRHLRQNTDATAFY